MKRIARKRHWRKKEAEPNPSSEEYQHFHIGWKSQGDQGSIVSEVREESEKKKSWKPRKKSVSRRRK